MSWAADEYALLMSLKENELESLESHELYSHEESIWQIPIASLLSPSVSVTSICDSISTDLECLEHMREWLHANQEMTDDHRGAEVCAIMEGFLSDTLQIIVARASRLSSSLSERTHRQGQTV